MSCEFASPSSIQSLLCINLKKWKELLDIEERKIFITYSLHNAVESLAQASFFERLSPFCNAFMYSALCSVAVEQAQRAVSFIGRAVIQLPTPHTSHNLFHTRTISHSQTQDEMNTSYSFGLTLMPQNEDPSPAYYLVLASTIFFAMLPLINPMLHQLDYAMTLILKKAQLKKL